MKTSFSSRVVFVESAGFVILLALTWLDESAHLPSLLFGGPRMEANWREAGLESVMILLVGVLVLWFTRRVLLRLDYLEQFIRVCAWCRKIQLDGKWVSLEDFLNTGLDATCTHGMCPDCSVKFVANIPNIDAGQKE